MRTNKFSLTGITLLILSILACSLQSGPSTAPNAELATNTGIELPSAVAGTLTAIASLATSTSTETPSLILTPITDTETPTDTPTQTFTPTSTHTPSKTFTPTKTATNGLLFINPIISKPINPIFPITASHLDYTASANYGVANLSAGFTPDPHTVVMTSGGNVDVSYLGGSCTGFANVSPDLRLNFGGGGSSLLRIYFKSTNGDGSMVINDPYGNFYCVDDSFGTSNPTLDFNNPAGGSYDIWIGNSVSGSNISGTLYITGNAANHP